MDKMEAWKSAIKEKKLFHQKSGRTGSTLSTKKCTSDLCHALSPIYPQSLILGLLPVRFSKDKSGKYVGELDKKLVVYGILLVSACVGALVWGVIGDLRKGWENSTRLTSEAAIAAVCGDVLAVMCIVLVAILGSSLRWADLRAAMNKMMDVDEKLGVDTSRNLRRLSIVVIVCSFAYSVTISVLDYISWSAFSRAKRSQSFTKSINYNYSPIYVMYQIILTVELQFALVICNVGERFARLNRAIESTVNKADGTVLEYSGIASANDHETLDEIDQLIRMHNIICDCIAHVNRAYSGTILMGTMSFLIHLVITPYFIYSEIHSGNSSGWYVLMMQFLWTIFHVYRLLLLVQPCYVVAVRAKMTTALVSEASKGSQNPEAKKKFELFSLQLMQRPVEFSVFGLFNIDRTLITSIAGTATTYVVILVQFQNADETKGTKNLLEDASVLLKNISGSKKL